MEKSYSLSIAEAAESDIRAAFVWYEKQTDSLGLTFEKHISKVINDIQKNPFKIQFRYNKTRVAFLKKFPYGVHFTIIENEIIILAVFHTSQDPKKWNTR